MVLQGKSRTRWLLQFENKYICCNILALKIANYAFYNVCGFAKTCALTSYYGRL